MARWDNYSPWDKSNLIKRLEKMSKIKEGHKIYYGSILNTGHARIQIGPKKYLVHRVSAYIFLGFDINSESLILHKQTCPYRSCWNKDCLYVGNHSDNNRDAYETGNRDRNSLRDNMKYMREKE